LWQLSYFNFPFSQRIQFQFPQIIKHKKLQLCLFGNLSFLLKLGAKMKENECICNYGNFHNSLSILLKLKSMKSRVLEHLDSDKSFKRFGKRSCYSSTRFAI
jgi:hypothetical protein